MATFGEFLSTFDADANRRGKQFERFAKWFLKNDPEWATQVKDVWLWDEYPERWGPDCGIDLVFKHINGKTWAVQAKCYGADHDITKNDVDRFLSESNRKQIDHRLLIATTDRLGANACQVLDAQEKPVVRFLLSHFNDAAVEFPTNVNLLSSGRRKPLPSLNRPHQVKAVDAIVAGFETSDRGQLIMACGTGKTYVCLWVKERIKAKRTLVLVPSLGLLSQTLNEWTFAARSPFAALCVCSDQTVGQIDDEAIGQVSDIPFPVSRDESEIIEFLQSDDSDQVIFCTYQSSPLIAKVQACLNVPRFDLVIADEAHRCAGKNDAAFGTVLDEEKIRSEKRLFATATPRVYRTSLKKAAAELGAEVVDMSDEKRFGNRFYTFSFGEAIERQQLTDYRVLVVGVDNDRIADWIDNRRLVATDSGLTTDARALAGQIGVIKAIKDWNLRRLITFHSRVKAARSFSEDVKHVSNWIREEHRLSGNLLAEYVSGEMPTASRRQKLMRLKTVAGGEIGLLSNARCLSEGVDVPALDGVAFIDPRSSEIDIVQSVGRAIRLSENKMMGTIVLPVFIGQTEDPEDALNASEFQPIWDVLEALKSHDERLSDELDQLRIELGARRKRSVDSGDLTKIVFDLPATVGDGFAQSLRARLVEKTTESWMWWYGLLQSFATDNGHCRVNQRHPSYNGTRLRYWVMAQRQSKAKDKLSLDRQRRLESLAGWSWDPLEDAWEEGFDRLRHFVGERGHSRVPQSLKTDDGYKLGTWVQAQTGSRNVVIRKDRRERLEALPGWSWDPRSDLWEEGFAHLKRFADQHGHGRVPFHFKLDGFKLGVWVSVQRLWASEESNYINRFHRIEPERKRRLEELPGWAWRTLEDKWEKTFPILQQFVDREGHSRVPVKYRTDDGIPLGLWVSRQRDRFARGILVDDRVRRLEALPGWVWNAHPDNQRRAAPKSDSHSVQWRKGFTSLQEFSKREGHARVLKKFRTAERFCTRNLGGGPEAKEIRWQTE
ncbi:superfamily II DNA or RNA helicase [Bradyrhizobium sp. GM5.1]